MTDAARIEPEPFQIRVDPNVIDDLRERLRRTRWPNSVDDVTWDHGISRRYLRDLVRYWHSGYDWRAHEARLNRVCQFKAEVDGANLFFVHVRGWGPRPLPLLLLHGWPDSFYRYHKVISAFADPASSGRDPADAFDVVVPSLPGFPFTGAVQRMAETQPTRQSAQVLWRLMTEVLGYERFMVAGGDGGSVIAQIMAIDHPESVIALHLTDLGWHALQVNPSAVSKRERRHLEASSKQAQADGAYALVQMTTPRSLAALNDSPAGLAAWILDRFHAWTDFDGDLESAIGGDELLTNIMLYWVTQTIGSSMLGYHGEARSPSLTPADYVERPVALALFPKDIGGIPPRSLAERTLNVQRWTEMPRGGHFAALEQPELYAGDVVAFARQLRGVRRHAEQEVRDVAPSL